VHFRLVSLIHVLGSSPVKGVGTKKWRVQMLARRMLECLDCEVLGTVLHSESNAYRRGQLGAQPCCLGSFVCLLSTLTSLHVCVSLFAVSPSRFSSAPREQTLRLETTGTFSADAIPDIAIVAAGSKEAWVVANGVLGPPVAGCFFPPSIWSRSMQALMLRAKGFLDPYRNRIKFGGF